MSLSKSENDLDAVLNALKDDNVEERAKAVSRLNRIDLWAETNRIDEVVKELTLAHEKEKHKIGKEKIKTVLNKYNIYLESTEEERAAIVNQFRERIEQKRKEKEEKEKAEKRKKDLEEKARLDAIEIRKEREKIAQEKKILENNKIMEEENELENFTYISRESSRRFPAHLFYFRTLIPIAIVLVSISGAIGFVGALAYEEGFALLVLVWTFIGAFSLLLAREIIRLILDFHDNNYINTKIKIETLNTLKDINENLKKKS